MDIKKLKRNELALCIGKSTKTVSRYRRQGMPVNSDDRTYNLPKCFTWIVSEVKAATMPLPSDKEGLKWLNRFRKERAKLVRIERKKAEGGLVSSAGVKKEAFEAGRLIRDQCQNIPIRIGALVASESGTFECEEILRKEINFVLEDLADQLKMAEPKE